MCCVSELWAVVMVRHGIMSGCEWFHSLYVILTRYIYDSM